MGPYRWWFREPPQQLGIAHVISAFVVLDDDVQAWSAFPNHRLWFNKLWLSDRLGYVCGPGGVPIPVTGTYVVRPIYNLVGMGVGARKCTLERGDVRSVPPGYFWCEWFEGEHLSATYVWADSDWAPVSVWRGVHAGGSLSRFAYWERSERVPQLPALIHALNGIPVINVEFVGDRPIEVHLRDTPDPQSGSKIIPVWADDVGFDGGWRNARPGDGRFVASFDDADGFLDVPRIGFIIEDM